MGVEYYKGKAVPLFESMKFHKDKSYGLAATESGKGYSLYELLENHIELRVHLSVQKGTLLELEVVDDALGIRSFDKDGNDTGFMKLQI